MINVEAWKKLSPGEQSLYNWQFNMHGGFYTALWKAISTADEAHLKKLARAFPSEVKAYIMYTREGGWWESLLAAVGRP